MRFLFTLLAVSVAFLPGPARAAPERPNIVIFLSDDMGWGQLGFQGGKRVPTPNLDGLAREGVSLTQFYVHSVCTPTRSALLTGRYPVRTGTEERFHGNDTAGMLTDERTLADALKAAGYSTAIFGKWHLGLGSEAKTDWNKPLKPGPLEIGFDYFFGMGSNPWTGPHSFIENHEITGRVPGEQVVVKMGQKGQNSTTGITKPFEYNQIMKEMTEKAVAWVDQTARARSSCISRPTRSTGR